MAMMNGIPTTQAELKKLQRQLSNPTTRPMTGTVIVNQNGEHGNSVGTIIVPDTQIFPDTTARDAYFVANPTHLSEGVYCVVGSELQRYLGGVWVDHSAVIRGEKGDTGEQGIQGIQGVQGSQGKQGDKGDIGVQGEQGIQGVQGIQGEQGEQGIQGTQGLQGIQGEKGDTGAQGESALSGINYKGEYVDSDTYVLNDCVISDFDGNTYACIANSTTEQPTPTSNDWKIIVFKGAKGDKGDTGENGVQGVQGVQGEQGIQGLQGVQGEQGERGEKGEKGDTPTVTMNYAGHGIEQAVLNPDGTGQKWVDGKLIYRMYLRLYDTPDFVIPETPPAEAFPVRISEMFDCVLASTFETIVNTTFQQKRNAIAAYPVGGQVLQFNGIARGFIEFTPNRQGGTRSGFEGVFDNAEMWIRFYNNDPSVVVYYTKL